MPASGPQAGEQIPQVLADGHAQVAVEGLEDDLDGVAGGWGGRRVSGEAGQVGDGEGPADQAQELHQGGQHADGGGQGQDGRVGVGQGGRQQDHGRGEQDRAHGEPPPDEDQAAAAGGEPFQDLAGWLAEDVGVVEAAGEQGVEAVVGNRKDQQQQAGQHLGGQEGVLSCAGAWEPTRPPAGRDRGELPLGGLAFQVVDDGPNGPRRTPALGIGVRRGGWCPAPQRMWRSSWLLWP
jgi:hypothetical protein